MDAVICGKILLQKAGWEISFICNFCEKNLSTLPELLRHALSEHVEDVTADKLQKLCGIEDKHEVIAESAACDIMLKEVLECQEQEEMDEEILQYFLNKAPKNINKFHKSKEASVSLEISDDSDVANNEQQSNSRFEFLDIDNTKKISDFKPRRISKKLALLQCDICNSKFYTELDYGLHKKKVHNQKPFSCTQCGNGFSTRRCLAIHEMRHQGIKQHACPFCGKAFVTMTDMKTHQLTHTNDRTYKCDECNKIFGRYSSLYMHRVGHKDNRAHLCDICGKSFNAYRLKMHILTHSTERPHKCQHCDGKFSTRKGLRQHMQLHSEVKKYSCKFCEKLFAQAAGVYSHIKSVHKHEKQIKIQ